MAYTKEDRLIEAAADETGFTIEQAKRVYGLMNEIDIYNGGSGLELKVIDGKVTVGWQTGFSGEPDEMGLSQSLWDKIEDLDFDIVELVPAIQQAWQAEFGFPYPTLYSTRPAPVQRMNA